MANEPNYIYDDKPIGSGGFGATADSSSLNTPLSPEPQGWGQMVGDMGRLAIGSTESQVGDIGRTLGYQQFGDDWNKSGQAWTESVSPGGKEITNAPIFSSETLQHPLSKLGMGAAKGGLWNVPAVIPGGGMAAMAARGIIGAGLGYTSAYGGVIDSINAQPDDQLQRASPTYMELRKTLPEYDAKQMLANQAWDNMGAVEKAAIVGTSALAGEAGPLTTVGKTVAGTTGRTIGARFAENRLAKAGINAVETGAVTGAQYAGTAIPTREALTSVGAPADTPSDIAMGTIEQSAVGAVIGGGTRFIRPHGGENESRSGTRDTWPKYVEPKNAVSIVPAGQPDPAAAAALKSASTTRPTSTSVYMDFTPQQAAPSRTGPMEYPEHPFPTAPVVWPGMGEDANRPPPPTPPPGPEPPPTPTQPPVPPAQQAPIPARPVPQPVRQGELPLTYERPNVPRQGELPLQAPQPRAPELQQGELPLQQLRQPVVQQGLPGMGADVVHERAPEVARSPDQDSPPAQYALRYDQQGRVRSMLKQKETPSEEKPSEPVSEPAPATRPTKEVKPEKPTAAAKPTAAPAKAEKVPVTKDSELPPETAKWLGEGEKPTTTEQPTVARDKFGKPIGTFKEIPAEAPAVQPTKAKTGPEVIEAKKPASKQATGTFDVSKLEGKTETPLPVSKAETRRQAVIAKLTEKKAVPTQVERPTEPVKGEPKVTVLPPSDARLGGIKVSDIAKAKAAEAMEAVEKAKAKVKAGGSDILNRIEKAFEEDVEKPSKPTLMKDRMKAAAQKIEEAKKNVHTNPTPAQEDARNFKQGHPPISATQGQPVTIHSAAGKEGEAEGHILGTAKNVPGEHLETIIHKDGVAGNIHVINEVNKDTGKFERHVAILGAKDSFSATNSFADMLRRKYIPDEIKGREQDLSGGIVHMTPEEFEHFKQTRNPQEPVYPTTEGKHPFDEIETFGKKVKTLGSSTIKTALEEAIRKVPTDPRDPNYKMYGIYKKLAQQIIKYLPDVPVYYLQRDVFDSLGQHADALYNATRNHILIPDSFVGKTPLEINLLHEALHAATLHLYLNNRVFKGRVDAILTEYKKGIGSLHGADALVSTNIRLGGGRELLADLANPKVMKQLSQIQMSNDLANELNMSVWAKATRTLWNGVVTAFKDGLRSLGFEVPGKDDVSKHTLLDGMLRVTDQAFVARSRLASSDFAKMIKTMEKHGDSSAASIAEEHNSQQNIYNTIHDVVSHPEALQGHYDSGAKSISDKASDLLDKLPRGTLKQKAYEYVVPFQGSDSLRMDKEGLFGPKTEANPYRRYNETGLMRDKYFGDRSFTTNNNISDMFDEHHGHTKAETEHFSDTLSNATAYRADPRYKIGEGTNAWMKSPGWQWRNEAKQAIANHPRIAKMYDAMAPGLKPRFTKMVDEYHAAGREHADKAVNELIDSITNAGPKLLTELKVTDPKDPLVKDQQEYIKFHNDWETNWDKNKDILRDHLLNNNLTEDEERWLAERGFKDISDIRDLASPRGPFVPLDHGGEFIINARTKIEPPTNGTLVNGTDNVFRFKTEDEASKFLDKQPPKSAMSTVYFNDRGDIVPKWEKWQNPDGSIGLAKDNKAYHVTVNNKYYSGHDSISGANRRYDALKASGLFEKIAPPQSQRSGWYAGLEISSPLFKHLISEVEKRTDYTDAQKKAVVQLLKDSALSSMEGNRIAKHLLPRKAIAGWETDYIKTYKNYFDAHNALMSRAKYAKDINTSINEMIKHANDNQFDAGATDRSLILRELNKRDNFFGTPNHLGDEGNGGLAGRVMKYAEAVSFFANMVSPGHLITHQTHQVLTFDMLAAKYGPAKTMARAGKMHGVLAGTGFRNVLRSVGAIRDILTKDSKGLNYVESLMDKVTQDPKYGAELKAMLEQAIATNRIHPDQGFDASVLNMGTGKLDRGLARLDLASRQMMGSTEAYSRVWGYSLGYTLARDAGETPQQAMRTAFDTVSRTQGLLSRSNMSSVMNKWYMRAPMQFRAWGINMMMTLAKSIHDVFKPDAPGVRAEAVRRLLYLFGSTAALTGINGLPSDPMRVGLALAGALGLTNYNWSDAQDKMREFFAEETSPAVANFLMDGALASLGPFSFFGADRVGFGSLAVFGEPDDYTKGSLVKWGLQITGGAPFEQLWDIRDGIDGINEGNYAKAIKAFVPLKIVADWAKAWQGAYEGFPTKTGAPGMTPYSAGETFMQSLGLTPARKERWREAGTAEYRAEKASRDEKTQLLNALGTATNEPDRIKARMQISAFNLRNPEARITPQDMVRAARRQTAPAGLGRTLGKSNRERIQSMERYYEAY